MHWQLKADISNGCRYMFKEMLTMVYKPSWTHSWRKEAI